MGLADAARFSLYINGTFIENPATDGGLQKIHFNT